MALKWFLVITFYVLWASADVTSRKTPQDDCDPDACGYWAGNSDVCTCASADTPLDDDIEYIPQLVVLSFDEAVQEDNYNFYRELQTTYSNPNGFPISMTFFVTHKYNDYSLTYQLWRWGNEIAAHSVSSTPDIDNYWKPANNETWFNEMYDLKQMLMKYGKIPEEDIKGWRSPFLFTGGDTMYQALYDAGFSYDSSISTYRYSNWYTVEGENEPRGALYPFTMDSGSDMQCSIGECPTESYPGFWVAPMTNLNDPQAPTVRAPCNTLGSCLGGNETNNKWDCKDDSCKYNLVAWLKESFHNHYDRNDGVRANRAPFGLYTDFAWFKIDDIGVGSRHRDAYKEFLDYLQDLDDVWIVSLSTVLEYMKDPMWIEDMEDWMKPFNPPIIPPTSDCPDPRVCTYDNPPFDGANHVDVTICTRPCPRSYPWLQNVDGN